MANLEIVNRFFLNRYGVFSEIDWDAVCAAVNRLKGEDGRVLGRVQVQFLSDEELRDMNRRHLDHDYLTDILTFEYANQLQVVDGELFISVDRVIDNAKIQSEPIDNELVRVVIHGCLHLLGWEDESEEGEREMRRLESAILSSMRVFHVKPSVDFKG